MKDKIRKLPPMRLERLTSHFFKKGMKMLTDGLHFLAMTNPMQAPFCSLGLMKMFKMFRSRKVLSANTSEHLFLPQNGPRLCKCCANSVLKKFKCLIIRHLTLGKVGMRRLERPTPTSRT